MSSHHIVREKQEPALLILGLNNFSFEQLGQLFEWSPTVIVTTLIAEELNSLGTKVDWIIGDDIDDIGQEDVKFIPVGNTPLLDVALRLLISKGYPSVNIVTDDFSLDEYIPYIDKINIVIFYNQQKIYPIHSGFTKWKPAGEKVELLTRTENLRAEGLESIGKNSYITKHDGLFSLSFGGAFMFIAEDI